MFIDEKTQNRIHAIPGESVSHGTMRTQDLIPVFMGVIRDTPEYVQMMNTIPALVVENKEADWWNSDEAVVLLESLFDTLDTYAPDNYYFGAHPGDGSDYGYWEIEPQEELTNVQKITAAAEKNGWNVSIDQTKDGLVLIEFSKFTPYGQDFNFSAEMKDDQTDTLAQSIREYYEGFDPDSEAYLWLGTDGHGRNGAPYHMKAVVSDMEAAQEMVYQLYTEISEIGI